MSKFKNSKVTLGYGKNVDYVPGTDLIFSYLKRRSRRPEAMLSSGARL